MADQAEKTLEEKCEEAIGNVLERFRKNGGKADEMLKYSQTALNLAQVRQMLPRTTKAG